MLLLQNVIRTVNTNQYVIAKPVKKLVCYSYIFFLELCAVRRVSVDCFTALSKASRLSLISSSPSVRQLVHLHVHTTQFLINVLQFKVGPRGEISISQGCADDEKKLQILYNIKINFLTFNWQSTANTPTRFVEYLAHCTCKTFVSFFKSGLQS